MSSERSKSQTGKLVAAMVTLGLSANWTSVANALDWGYDAPGELKHGPVKSSERSDDSDVPTAHKPQSSEQLKRQLPAQKGAKPVINKPNLKASGSSHPTTAAMFSQPDVIDIDKAIRFKQAKVASTKQQQLEKGEKLADQWLELYSLVSAEPLTSEQTSRFQHKLVQVAAQPGNNGLLAINKFWPMVKKACHENVEQSNNYRALFRTLLRLEVHDKQTNPVEVDLVGEVLGPERIAVPEQPPLTEEAVEAYADMMCFIYAQTHPGKTVDALDNRTVFVATMEHRYMNEATPLEKLAMSHFALKWTKFKVLYADADEADKAKLFRRISGKTPESLHKDISNETLDTVMNNGPWVHALTSSSELSVPKLPPKVIEEKAEAKSL